MSVSRISDPPLSSDCDWRVRKHVELYDNVVGRGVQPYVLPAVGSEQGRFTRELVGNAASATAFPSPDVQPAIALGCKGVSGVLHNSR